MSDDIVSRLAALEARLRDGAAPAAPAASTPAPAPTSTPAPLDPQSIASIVAQTVAALQAPRSAPPAAAPAAPVPNSTLPSNNGLPDIFQPGVAAQMGPREVRRVLEQAWSMHDERMGAPPRRKPPR